MSDFKANLAQVASQTEDVLRGLLPNAGDNPVADPMRHAVLNGGQRLRAFLAVETTALFDVDPTQSYRAAA